MSFKKTQDRFKVNESACIVKSRQYYVITAIRIFENESKSRRLDEKMFSFYMSVLYSAFVKSSSYYVSLIALFQ